jgi:hypothetical protein
MGAVHVESYTKHSVQFFLSEDDKPMNIYCRMKAVCVNICLYEDYIPKGCRSLRMLYRIWMVFGGQTTCATSLLTILWKQNI